MRNRQQESGEPVAFTNLLWEALNNANRKKIEDYFEQQGRSTVQAMECWEVRKNRKGEIEKKEFAKITNEHPFYEELKKHEDQVAERGTKEALDEEIEKGKERQTFYNYVSEFSQVNSRILKKQFNLYHKK
jgi:oligoribonuclease NrnB/cAMP/cGMP phosphodiesterase (DHH superfamily)